MCFLIFLLILSVGFILSCSSFDLSIFLCILNQYTPKKEKENVGTDNGASLRIHACISDDGY